MQKYVVGFAFNHDMTQTILIRKNRPSWQKGLLNGVGGKVEEDEDCLDAMIREFGEETSVECANWKLFHEEAFESGAHVVFFYSVFSAEGFEAAHTTTDEEVVKIAVNALTQEDHQTIYNIPYLLEMAKVTHQHQPGRVSLLSHVLQGFSVATVSACSSLVVTSPAGDSQRVWPSEQSRTGRILHALASALLPR